MMNPSEASEGPCSPQIPESPSPAIDPEAPCPICCELLIGRPQTITDCQHTFHTDCLNDWIRPTVGSGSPTSFTCPCCRHNMTLTYSGPELPKFDGLLPALFAQAQINSETSEPSRIVTFQGPLEYIYWTGEEKPWVGWINLKSGPFWDYPAREFHVLAPSRRYGRIVFDEKLMRRDGMKDIEKVWDAITFLKKFSLSPCNGQRPNCSTNFWWFPNRDLNLNSYRYPARTSLNLQALRNVSPEDLKDAMYGYLDSPWDAGEAVIESILATLPTLPRFTINWEESSSAVLPNRTGNARLIKHSNWAHNELIDDEDTVFDLPDDDSHDDSGDES